MLPDDLDAQSELDKMKNQNEQFVNDYIYAVRNNEKNRKQSKQRI